jgi:hypothetical protein
MSETATGAPVWEAVHFGGRVNKERRAALRFGLALEISENGVFLTAWPYAEARRQSADGGAAYLIGLLFGHVTGGGALIYATKTLLFAAHSRVSEASADAFAAATLGKIGRPA